MLDSSIITGKVWTSNLVSSNAVQKRLYIKIFPGEFWYRAPRVKKAKLYGGELFVRYSQREWPEKKNGPLLGDQGLLSGVVELLQGMNLQNASQIQYAKNQHNLKETLTLTVGPELAKEIIDRGWVKINDYKEPVVPKINNSIDNTTALDAQASDVVTIGEIIDNGTEELSKNQSLIEDTIPILDMSTKITDSTKVTSAKKPSKKTKSAK